MRFTKQHVNMLKRNHEFMLVILFANKKKCEIKFNKFAKKEINIFYEQKLNFLLGGTRGRGKYWAKSIYIQSKSDLMTNISIHYLLSKTTKTIM